LQSITEQNGRYGSMLLKKSVAGAVYATIESRRSAIRIEVAPSTGFLSQSCAVAPSKSFFNNIGQNQSPAFATRAAGLALKADIALRPGGPIAMMTASDRLWSDR
jgi:hypothetical protein